MQMLPTPDRTKWDLYLIDIPFTLHEAPNGSHYRELTFYVELDHPQANAYDLFPSHVTTPVAESRTYTLSPQMKIQELDLSIGQFSKQISFTSLRPVISAFGEGENKFYWKFKGIDGKEVIPETRHVLIVLQIPRGTPSVDAHIHYRTDVAEPFFRGWFNKIVPSGSHTLHLNLQAALTFTVMQTHQPEQAHVVAKAKQHIDVCVFCALWEEAGAFKEEAMQQYGLTFKPQVSSQGLHYYSATMLNADGKPLALHLSWLPKSGPIEASLHIQAVLEEFHPYFATMTGICAGDRAATGPGDLVVAESAFSFDAGKVVLNNNGEQDFWPDTEMWHPRPEVLQFAKGFVWPKSAGSFPGTVHIAPMAAGQAVRADNPFPRIRMLVRKAIALDMESAAFYRVLAGFPHIRALLVKGITDHADNDKGDTYHRFAAAASALYMLAFIKEYVTSAIIQDLK